MAKTTGESKAITTRAADFSQWYLDVIEAAQLAENSVVRGSMVIKPHGFAIWENMQKALDGMFKATGVANAYFPLFIPESFLKREAEHIKGFAPEVAVVTRAGGEELAEPYVIRPTSETIIYDTYARWIQSYRDLPLLINQWCNVVRWEMRPRLFLRTTEFLWQEGHTVHATQEEAAERVLMMLEVYRKFCEEYLAMPVLAGLKSESEKFAGADYTACIEALMQDGKALQAGTSHMLGQNFAKSFGVKFLSEKGVEEFAWQTSWGVSTRLVGALIMTHSDDKGLVLPPKIAPFQVIIIPIWTEAAQKEEVLTAARKIQQDLVDIGISAKIDDRDLRAGARFFEWEKKGIPVRLELGPKDIAAQRAVVARRDTGDKQEMPIQEVTAGVHKLLTEIQDALYNRALRFREERTNTAESYAQLKTIIEDQGGFIKAWWCESAECEAKVKQETKATIRCVPFVQPASGGKGACVVCGIKAPKQVIFARAY